MLYNKNFDDAKFKEYESREFNRSIDDPCYLQQEASDNAKKLKFITTNHVDLLEAKDKLNFYGMTVRDQLFVPSDRIDNFSKLKNGSDGYTMTNCKVKNGLGQLPFPTMPSRYQLFHGDVTVEDSMRNLRETNKKSCNPSDKDFHNRSFYIFNDEKGIETPKAFMSVESKEFGPRGGKDTRFINRTKK